MSDHRASRIILGDYFGLGELCHLNDTSVEFVTQSMLFGQSRFYFFKNTLAYYGEKTAATGIYHSNETQTHKPCHSI